ncbi:DUF2771 domain-containing protein [Mycolicibacterium confluentis]|uniref:DUF2771 domain-containing protein n=1 Tax=Mycolicibacterium confluentis TaxID=28047 RepID=UPI000A1617D2|nr:DUF2771 domain-containing protein [Mycolicibacterium confluentis]MCV7318640.1 DUF2771 domain-containing protein [Mycolicibacterium confluentis]ORV23225.1 hypothetical protein AWB99_25330 [Mycolicibacterium confluentis]
MKRTVAVVSSLAVVLASAGAGVGAWALARGGGHELPEISVYSHGELVRVKPYRYCNPLNLNDCDPGTELGELPVDHRNPVQLSVPSAIGKAPWWLTLAYEDGEQSLQVMTGDRLAVTVPTVDPQHGRLFGMAVELPTLVVVDGEEMPASHAEWSVRTVWEQRQPKAAD